MLLIDASASPFKGFFPTLISVSVLITPAITLLRWLQERRYSHRLHDNLEKSKGLLEFIERHPEMMKAVGSSEENTISDARAELKRTLTAIGKLLQRQKVSESMPKEVSWPARLLLFYAPRTWLSGMWHLFYHIMTAVLIIMLFESSYDAETGSYRWSEFVQTWGNPLLAVVLVLLGLLMWTMRYTALTKDTWDQTLPSRPHIFFLTNTATTVRELVARIVVIWAAIDCLSGFAVQRYLTPLQRALPSWMDTMYIPELVYIVNRLTPAVALVIAYFWARTESRPSATDAHLPIPRNLRFFYSPTTQAEHWYRAATVWFLLSGIALTWYSVQYFRAASATIDPDEWFGIVIGGTISAALMTIYHLLLPLYGCYRSSLVSYWSHLRLQELPVSSQSEDAK